MPKRSVTTKTQALGLLPRPSRNGGKPARTAARHASLALVQFAPRKGDVDANVAQIADAFSAIANDDGPFPDVVVFPETSLSGYFVEGGVREVAMTSRDALERIGDAAKRACGKSHKPFDIVVGFYERSGGKHYNSAMYATLGKTPEIAHLHRKMFLPTYGVFDEERFVSRGRSIDVFETRFGRAAILICEDACHSLAITVAALRGAEILYIPSASPGRGLQDAEPANVRMWRGISTVAAAEFGIFIAYAGLLGFEGGKGFTGSSRVVGPFGDLRAEAPFDQPAILRVDIGLEDVVAARAGLPMLGDLESNLAEIVDLLNADLGTAPNRAKAKKG